MPEYEPHLDSAFDRSHPMGRSVNSAMDRCLPSTYEQDQRTGPGRSEVDSGLRLQDSVKREAKFDASFDMVKFSYPRWCAQLTSLVLRTRTPFAALLARTFHLPRVKSTAPTLFPAPLPEGEWFARMPHDLSLVKRKRIHLNRAVHIIVLALNFWHFGGHVDLGSLGRAPSTQHLCLFARIRRLIRSEGLACFETLASSGRRLPQLVARLGELSDALTLLGPSCNPYDRSFQGYDVPPKNETDELKPYRNLDASRLVLKGSGHWDATPYLDDELVMAYREPASLLFEAEDYGRETWPVANDPEEEIGKLAHLWDSRGLLFIHDGFSPSEPECKTRIFNAYKSSSQDRQIGDRRARNSVECRVSGPSRDLPCGFDLIDLQVNPRTHYLAIAVTDRKDFYHQFYATPSRSRTNTVGPAVPFESLSQTKAFEEYALASSRLRYKRSLHGDRLGWRGLRQACERPHRLFACFRSILQGDHAGVDIATCAHASLLTSIGLLPDHCRLRSSRPLEAQADCEGLCIDDYFAISRELVGVPLSESRASKKIATALTTYEQHKLLGSPEKDVLGDKAKVVGAQVNSSAEARKRGMVLVGAPIEKRISLSLISLKLSALTHTTDVLHTCLVGGWVSAFMFRRPLMSLSGKVFSLVDASTLKASEPKMLRLPRQTANELVLASVLIPFAASELSADYMSQIFCTDASSAKGAFCSASVRLEVSEVLWKATKSKGAYSRLLSPVEVAIKRHAVFEERPSEAEEGALNFAPSRPLAYRFDFVEVFAGSAKITAAMVDRGRTVCQPIDLSASPEYDMTRHYVMSWVSHLISNRLVKAFSVEPPCTTFSVMRRPALRSKQEPYGFDVIHEQTRTGTSLALRGLQCLHLGERAGVPGWLETPYSSKLKALPPYEVLRKRPAFDFCRTDSCCFGSPHQKSFAFLSVLAPLARVRQRCKCTSSGAGEVY